MKLSAVAVAALMTLAVVADAGQYQYQSPKRKRPAGPKSRIRYRNEDYPGKELLKRQIAEAEFRVADAKFHWGTRSVEYKLAKDNLKMLRERQRMENMLHRKPVLSGGY